MIDLSIKNKLISLTAISLIALSTIILTTSVIESLDIGKKDKLSQLSSITSAKKDHITGYIDTLSGLLISVSNTTTAADALFFMGSSFKNLAKYNEAQAMLDEGLEISEVKKDLENHYDDKYLNNVNFSISSIPNKKETSHYLPKTENGLIAQYLYIEKNEAKIGEKNDMPNEIILNSAYSINHTKYHNTFNTILKKFKLYDIFLVDLDGNIVYSTFKEKDFATNLKTGPYSNSGIAEVNNKSYDLKLGEVAFSDFKPYEPSYNTPASFISTPVFRNGGRLGNLIMQLPISEIDKIMSFDNKYEEAGLKKTGNAYLIGSDYKMRNDYRFIDKITDANVKSSKTTISFYEIKTEATQNAFKKGSGTIESTNVQGENVFVAYDTFNIFDTKWAIISEMNVDEAIEEIISVNIILVAVAFVVLLITLFISITVLNNSVIKKLELFEDGLLGFFKYLNKETKDVEYLSAEGNDEISKMANVVNENIKHVEKTLNQDVELIEDAKIVMARVKNGWYSQHIEKSTSNSSLEEFKNDVNQMIESTRDRFVEVDKILREYVQHNYTVSLNMKDTDEKGGAFEKLVLGINTLQNSITQMLVENKTNGLTLDKSSNVLLSNVNNLNTSSNNAAASLEETAAAIEEITSNIRNNTQNIVKMATNSSSVTASAKDGEKLANQTTQAMEEINTQVSSINEAITVIDQIAFQTNILSLNAAVEAATAGEAGKGFAVVAQEVRNLASRSAEAAKEIKTIVENATSKANQGKDIANDMINGYKELNENISQTINLISDIESSSNEQLSGIEQINDAVNRLDQQTQENTNIASQTNHVALITDEIAKLILSNANEKEFIGKNEIKAKNIEV